MQPAVVTCQDIRSKNKSTTPALILTGVHGGADLQKRWYREIQFTLNKVRRPVSQLFVAFYSFITFYCNNILLACIPGKNVWTTLSFWCKSSVLSLRSAPSIIPASPALFCDFGRVSSYHPVSSYAHVMPPVDTATA